MDVERFRAKWAGVTLTERSASQSHFNDLCALFGVAPPVAADPTGEWFTFEKGATKATGGRDLLRDVPAAVAAGAGGVAGRAAARDRRGGAGAGRAAAGVARP